MKRTYLKTSFLLAMLATFALAGHAQQGVVIGSGALAVTPTPDPNAILWLIGDGKQGLILPIVAGTASVITPAKGMVVYNSTDNSIYYYNGTWAPVGGSGGTSVATLLKISGNNISIDPQGSGSIGLANTPPGTIGQILMWNGAKWDVSSSTAPTTAGQVLAWNTSTNQWEASTGGDMLKKNNLSDVNSTASARTNLGFGNITYTWPTTNTNGILSNSGGVLSWSPLSIAGIAASGDLTGTYPGPTIANNAVTTGKILDGTITANDLSAGINITTTGNVNASNFTGNGGGLSNLNAGNITSGTLGIGHGGTGASSLAANVVPRSTGVLLQAGIISDNGASVTINGDAALTGYTQLGATSPAIQLVEVTGTTSNVADGVTIISLPVDFSKIVFTNIFVVDVSNELIPPMYLRTGFQTYSYAYFITGFSLFVVNLDTAPFGSGSIRNRPIQVTIGFKP